MNLRFNDFDLEFKLSEDRLNFITIEDPEWYYKVILEIHDALYGLGSSFVLVENDKILECSKTAVMIIDPLRLSLDDTAFKRELMKEISNIVDQGQSVQELIEINSLASRLIDRLSMELPFDLEYDLSIGLKDLLSTYKVHIKPVEGNVVERLVEYMTIVHRLTSKQVFIIVNISDLLTEQYYAELDKFSKYEAIQVVFINVHQIKTGLVVNEKLIDYDLCEI